MDQFFPKPDFEKHLIDSLNFTHFIESDNEVFLSDSEGRFKEHPCKITKDEDQLLFQLLVPYGFEIPNWELKEVTLKNSVYTLFSEKIYITNKRGHERGYVYNGHINFAATKIFKDDEEYFIRLIIPVDSSIKFDYSIGAKFTIRNEYSKNGKKSFMDNYRCLIPIALNSKNFHFYIISQETERHLIIDSLDKINYSEFHKCIWSIMSAFGFITGNLVFDQGYFTLSEDSDFSRGNFYLFRTIYKNVKAGMPAIYTNNHAYIHSNTVSQQDLAIKMEVLSIEKFCEICVTLYTNEDMLRAINVFLEANTQEIFIRCALFSIAIETLAGIINRENPATTERFLPDDALWLDYRAELLKVHQKYKERIQQKLTSRHDVFESGIFNLNRLGTTALLFNPFNLYKINLSEEETNSLNFRNKFLHGENPFLSSKNLALGKTTFQMTYYTSLVLQTLFVKLFLKHIKYEGFILNFVKIHSNIHKIEVSQSPFIEI